MKTAAAIAALSGASALIFENLWFRSAALALGSSMWASATVLSAFMFGLALGSIATTAMADRISKPFRAYAWLEIVIGLSGLVVLFLLPGLAASLAPLFGAASPVATGVLRVSVAFVLLVAPAACMGATLPVLVKGVADSPQEFGAKLGWIYGANTAGAVVGVLACELVLVPRLGVAGAGFSAAAVNGLAAAVAIAAGSGAIAREGAIVRSKRPRRVKAAAGVAPAPVAVLLAAAFALGALFLAFEIVTFRFLLLFFTALSTNFAIILAVVLGGLAAGGVAARWLIPRSSGGNLLPVVVLTGGTALLGAYALFPVALRFALSLDTTAAIAAAVVAFALPLAIVSGLAFALVGHAVYASGRRDARAAGLVTASNTIGAMAGSIVAGVVLVERFGLERVFLMLALGYGAVASLLAIEARRRASPPGRSVGLAAAAFAAGLFLFPSGQMGDVYLRFPINALTESGEQLIAVKEGQLETLQYLRADTLGQPDYYRLVTNNHSMAASDVRSRRYMRLFAHLPSVLHPAPETAALLGVGLGVTAKALTEDPRFSSIHVVDVSPDIPEMLSVVFPDGHDNPLRDPRVTLHIDDGRFFLGTTRQSFDVITAEPPPPHYAGVANLYSQEFFQLLANRLKPGGLATYWLPVHDLTVAEARAVVAAFLAAFPETTLWTGSGLDWMLMGLKPPGGGVDARAFRAWWTRPPVADGLRSIGIERPESIGALFLADGPRLRAWVGDTPALTDNFPRRISTGIQRSADDVREFVRLMAASERPVNFVASPLVGSLWPDEVRAASLGEFRRQAVVDALLALPVVRLEDLETLLGDGPLDPLAVKAMFWRHSFDFDRTRAILQAQPGAGGAGLAEYQAQLALMNGRPREAAEWLARAVSPRAHELLTIRAYCLVRAGDREAANDLLRGYRPGSPSAFARSSP